MTIFLVIAFLSMIFGWSYEAWQNTKRDKEEEIKRKIRRNYSINIK